MKGFLGTRATFAADLNLLVQVAMGLALLVGAWLARRKRFAEHGVCQTTVLLLNLVMIALVMGPSFHQVAPQLPAGLQDRYYAVATIHAGLGTAAELLGLYIVLVAATRFIPKRLRFQRWKVWMRTELALWWLVVLIGVGTYYVWYMAPEPKAAGRPAAVSAGRVAVKLTNFAFTPREVTVKAGSTVEWVDDTGRHTVEADDASFRSATLTSGDHFEHTFSQPGVFPYHCRFHGAAGGKNMAGVIRVLK
jgi:plastocyanin